MINNSVQWDYVLPPSHPHYDVGGSCYIWNFASFGWSKLSLAGNHRLVSYPDIPAFDGNLRMAWSQPYPLDIVSPIVNTLLNEDLGFLPKGAIVAWTEAFEDGKIHLAIARLELAELDYGPPPSWFKNS
jgi:hypothetical protein